MVYIIEQVCARRFQSSPGGTPLKGQLLVKFLIFESVKCQAFFRYLQHVIILYTYSIGLTALMRMKLRWKQSFERFKNRIMSVSWCTPPMWVGSKL